MEGMAHKHVMGKQGLQQEWVSSIQSKDIWTQSNWSEVGLRIGGSSRRGLVFETGILVQVSLHLVHECPVDRPRQSQRRWMLKKENKRG